jgi:GxxExxY protein
MMADLLFKDESYALVGACFEVYNAMGQGFLEAVYQESLEIELGLRGIPFVALPQLQLTYKGYVLKKTYQPDLTCFGQIIVELRGYPGRFPGVFLG